MNYWVSAVDARNREYAQLMRKFQVEANLHDASKRSMSEQLHAKHELQVSDSSVLPCKTSTTACVASCEWLGPLLGALKCWKRYLVLLVDKGQGYRPRFTLHCRQGCLDTMPASITGLSRTAFNPTPQAMVHVTLSQSNTQAAMSALTSASSSPRSLS